MSRPHGLRRAARPIPAARGGRWAHRVIAPVVESLETRLVLAGGLEISEFLAKNENGIRDDFGERRDWIELHNASSQAIDLDGYFLTDDAGELNKWRFPAVTLNPDQYLVVFASELDRRDPAERPHTNFKLKDEGDYLALVAPDGQTVVQDFGPQFPPQIEDFSYGIAVNTTTSPLVTAGARPRVRVP